MGKSLQISAIFSSIFLPISASLEDLHLWRRIIPGRLRKLAIHGISETTGVLLLDSRQERVVGLGDRMTWRGDLCRELMWMLIVRRRRHDRKIHGGRC
jgi:hypothetical protein